jgi:hypothetical protein
MDYEVLVSAGQATDVNRWNNLAVSNGNLIQHTITAAVDTFFGSEPVYIEILKDNNLVAGYRFSFNESKRLPSFLRYISRRANFWSEAIHASEVDLVEIESLLSRAINEYLHKQRIVKVVYIDYYGYGITPSIFKRTDATKFRIAQLDLSLSETELWDNIHSKHRNVIRKAEKNQVRVELSTDIDLFIQLLQTTYEGQTSHSAPNSLYIKSLYEKYAPSGNILIYIAYHEDTAFSASIVTTCGEVAYYAFAGNIKNFWLSGQIIQWHIMKDLKAKGFKKYVLGQVKSGSDTGSSNDKFINGISPFKMRFGPTLAEGVSTVITLKPFASFLWNVLVKILIRK